LLLTCDLNITGNLLRVILFKAPTLFFSGIVRILFAPSGFNVTPDLFRVPCVQLARFG